MKQRLVKQSNIARDSSPCPYFEDGRILTIEYLIPDYEESTNFHIYLAHGYRRYSRIFYRNVCKQCSECKPIRIDTNKFKPSKSNVRTLKKNSEVRLKVLAKPDLTREKYLLYRKYLFSKHGAGYDEDNHINTLVNIHFGYNQSVEMNYFLGTELIGVGIVDNAKDSTSSNYFYYDTDHLNRRLGVLSILKEIELAKSLGKKYYYLGFYIEQNSKMSYKKFFRPNQIRSNGKWRDLFRK